jgi:hypothetical protein
VRRAGLLICGLLLAGLAGWGYWSLVRGPSRNQLLDAAKDADRIVVVHGTLGRTASKYGTPAFEVRGADAVQDFLRTVDWVGTTGRCACGGNYRIDLYSGDALLVSLGYHHGRFLRLDPRWRTDVEMTEDSRQAVADWFARRGFPGFREVLEDEPGWGLRY